MKTSCNAQALRPSTSTFAIVGSPTTDEVVGNIEHFLQDAVLQLEPAWQEPRQQGRGRPRILPSLCLWAGMLVCVIRGLPSQLAIWRLLSLRQLWFYPRFPVSDQAVYKRLEQEGTAPLERLFSQISAVLRERLAPFAITNLAPFASEVVAVDQMHLDQVARLLPALRDVPAGSDPLMPGAIGAVFDLRRQQWRKVEHHAAPHQNEKVAARSLVEDLPLGSLILADLGYFAFAWFDALEKMGHWWVSRLRAKTSYEVIHVLYQREGVLDALVWLGAYRADRAAHAVRLVQFRVGTAQFSYVTNVLDPLALPLKEIARLYARRWDIELAFNLIKTHLGLHLLWSAKTVVVVQQLWAVLIISQVVQALRLEIAGRAGVDPFEVSLPLMLKYLPQYGFKGVNPLAAFVEDGRAMRFIRPSKRTQIQAPEVPADQIVRAPPDLVLTRTARYAERKNTSRN